MMTQIEDDVHFDPWIPVWKISPPLLSLIPVLGDRVLEYVVNGMALILVQYIHSNSTVCPWLSL